MNEDPTKEPRSADEPKAAEEHPRSAFEERDQAQEQELRAHDAGDVGEELKGFAKEVVADARRFPDDVVEDATDPDRRVNDQQGVPVHPEAEPKTKR